MFGLDDLIAEWGKDGGIAVAFLVALLLGLRHATDPDHLTAVSSLILAEREGGRRGALRLGLAWGAGHALTLLALGLPFVLWGDALPERVQQVAEIAIGLLIVGLAVRLLVRWRRGYFHVHPHRHGDVVHAHPHVHEGAHGPHEHPHAEGLGRTPHAAFGIGLVHGIGGSAGAGILLVSSIDDRATAAIALVVFARRDRAVDGPRDARLRPRADPPRRRVPARVARAGARGARRAVRRLVRARQRRGRPVRVLGSPPGGMHPR